MSAQVGVRTIRRDVDRLRRLGYPVQAPGAAGGYRLGAGAELPPLLLDDEEAVAVAVALRTAAGGTVAGIEETSLRALAKLELLLPSRLRRRVRAFQEHTVSLVGTGGTVAAEVLATIAGACRDHERLRFRYRSHTAPRAGAPSSHTASSTSADVGISSPGTSTATTGARSGSTGSSRGSRPTSASRHASCPTVTSAPTSRLPCRFARDRYQARVILHAPLETLKRRVPPTYGTLEAIDQNSCLLRTGSDWLGGLAVYVAMIGVDFEVLDPPEFVEQVRLLADRFARAAA